MDCQHEALSLPSPMSPSATIRPSLEDQIQASCRPSRAFKKRLNKNHVPTACIHCQKAHLACDLSRPCNRCVSSGRADTCFNAQHKKRGRPKQASKLTSAINATELSELSPADQQKSIWQFPPGFVRSSFAMTMSPNAVVPELPETKMVTFILSMDVCCARVSDEAMDLLGIHPDEFSHRSLYDFVTPSQAKRVAHAHRRLLDNISHLRQWHLGHTSALETPFILPPTRRATSNDFHATCPLTLVTMANGSQTIKDTICFKTSNGEKELHVRLYLGGGLGANLFMPSTTEHLYIVCIAAGDAQSPSSKSSPTVRINSDWQTLSTSLLLSPTSIPRQSTIHLDSSQDATFKGVPSLLEHRLVTATIGLSSFDSMLNQSFTDATEDSGPPDTFLIDDQALIRNQERCASMDHIAAASSTHAPSFTPSPIPSPILLDDVEMETLQFDSQPLSLRKWSMRGNRPKIAAESEVEPLSDLHFVSGFGVWQGPRASHICHPGTLMPRTVMPSYKQSNSLWAHPHQLYYMKIASSHLSAEALAMVGHATPYQSPSAPMAAVLQTQITFTNNYFGPASVIHRGVLNKQPRLIRSSALPLHFS